MNAKQASRSLGISVRTLMRRVAQGKLGCRRDGKRLIFEKSELERYRRHETEHLGRPPDNTVAELAAIWPRAFAGTLRRRSVQ